MVCQIRYKEDLSTHKKAKASHADGKDAFYSFILILPTHPIIYSFLFYKFY